MAIQIVYKQEAIRHLKRIGNADKKKAKKKVLSLLSDPLAGKLLKGEFSGVYSLRAWPLRILYIFNPKTKTIIIQTVEYRGQVYK